MTWIDVGSLYKELRNGINRRAIVERNNVSNGTWLKALGRVIDQNRSGRILHARCSSSSSRSNSEKPLWTTTKKPGSIKVTLHRAWNSSLSPCTSLSSSAKQPQSYSPVPDYKYKRIPHIFLFNNSFEIASDTHTAWHLINYMAQKVTDPFDWIFPEI